jgi:hypothetical protein
VFVLRQVEAGTKVKEIVRKLKAMVVGLLLDKAMLQNVIEKKSSRSLKSAYSYPSSNSAYR